MVPLELMVEEYRTLRQEVLISIQERNRLLAFGSTILALLFAGGFMFLSKEPKPTDVISIWSHCINTHDFIVTTVFTFSIPSVIFVILFLLLAEGQRLARAGDYLAKLENKINSYVRQNYTSLQINQSVDFPLELQFSAQELGYILYWENWLKQKRYHFLYGAIMIGFLFNIFVVLCWLISFPYAQRVFPKSPHMVFRVEAVVFLFLNILLIYRGQRISQLMRPKLKTESKT